MRLLLLVLSGLLLPDWARSEDSLLRIVGADGSVANWVVGESRAESVPVSLPAVRAAGLDPVSAQLMLTLDEPEYARRAVLVVDALTLAPVARLPGANHVIVPARPDVPFLVAAVAVRPKGDTSPYDPELLLDGYDWVYRFLDRRDPRRVVAAVRVQTDDVSGQPTNCDAGGGLRFAGYPFGKRISPDGSSVVKPADASPLIGLQGCWPDGIGLVEARQIRAYDFRSGRWFPESVDRVAGETCLAAGPAGGVVECVGKVSGKAEFRVRRIDLRTGNIAESTLGDSGFAADSLAIPVGGSRDGQVNLWKAAQTLRLDRVRGTGRLLLVDARGARIMLDRIKLEGSAFADPVIVYEIPGNVP